MVKYKLYENYLDRDFCDYLVDSFRENFEYTPEHGWQAYTLKDQEIQTQILSHFSSILNFNHKVTWINISEYHKDVIGLRRHVDSRSNCTIVGEISENYTGGRFLLGEDTYITLKKGDVLVFNGGNTRHGVEKVTEGTRLSLNIWTQRIGLI